MKPKLLQKSHLSGELQKKAAGKVRLTAEEDDRWVELFAEHMNDGASEEAADQLAWEQLQEEFPRLQGFDGCLPDLGRPTSVQ